MMLSELKMSNLTLDQSDRILNVCEDIAMEINDPNVTLTDVARDFAQDAAEIDRWNASGDVVVVAWDAHLNLG